MKCVCILKWREQGCCRATLTFPSIFSTLHLNPCHLLIIVGNVFTATMHTFCAVVGAGVLALPYSVSWLGWVAGPTLIIVFFLISLLSSRMLAMCYEANGIEHGRYHHVGTCCFCIYAACSAVPLNMIMWRYYEW